MVDYLTNFYTEMYKDFYHHIAYDYNMSITYDEFMYDIHSYVSDGQMVWYILDDDILSTVLSNNFDDDDYDTFMNYDILSFFHDIGKYENEIVLLVRKKKIDKLLNKSKNK